MVVASICFFFKFLVKRNIDRNVTIITLVCVSAEKQKFFLACFVFVMVVCIIIL